MQITGLQISNIEITWSKEDEEKSDNNPGL